MRQELRRIQPRPIVGKLDDMIQQNVMTAFTLAMLYDVQAGLPASERNDLQALYTSLLALENATPHLVALLDAAFHAAPGVVGAASVHLAQVSPCI
jgi:hypothetical protein